MHPIEISVHPSALAALREDARLAFEAPAGSAPSSPVAAWLVGLSLRESKEAKASTTVRIVGVVRCSSSSSSRNLSEDLAATTALLPGGVSVVGAATFVPSCPPPSQSLRSLADTAAAAARAAGGASAAEVTVSVDGGDDGHILWLVGGEERQVVAFDVDEGTSTATAAAPATPPASAVVAALSTPRSIDPWIASSFSCVHCGPLEVSGGIEGAQAALAELCGDGDGGDPGDAVFVVAASPSSSAPILLAGDGPAPQSSSASSPLLVAPHSSPPPPPQQRSRLSAKMGPPPAPTAVFEPRKKKEGQASPLAPPPRRLVLDAIAFYPKTATSAEAASALRVALSRQLRAATTSTTAEEDSLRASPFLLPGLPVFVTPLLPFTSPRGKERIRSPSAVGARAALAGALRVPPGLPLLRPSAAAFSRLSNEKAPKEKNKSVNSSSKLLDVHLRLPCYSSASKSKNSTSSSPLSNRHVSFTPPLPPSPTLSCATVAGSYRYFHYGQDGCDDKGWGCAYRSLQTLWSWFAENHFFGFDVDVDGNESDDNEKKKKLSPPFDPPSHAEIQRTLVNVGDKPPSFVGSQQWIGAMEISYVLDSLAGLECKVHTVPSGKAMASSAAAGALVAHFRSQGTPAMIGGGVLAYTCLGAAFDSESGEASFLILDPHYCGVSDKDEGGGKENSSSTATANVIKGGWVSWKKPGDSAAAGGPLFVDDAFYNILLPQRPRDAV